MKCVKRRNELDERRYDIERVMHQMAAKDPLVSQYASEIFDVLEANE